MLRMQLSLNAEWYFVQPTVARVNSKYGLAQFFFTNMQEGVEYRTRMYIVLGMSKTYVLK